MTGRGEVAQFRALLADRLGWSFADNDVAQLERVLRHRSATLGLSPVRYLGRVAKNEQELLALAEDLTITETYFFRHPEQMRALAGEALPERLAARSAQRVLRMLSVGCSSGEEAYTLGIIAREAQPDPDWIIAVLGVDANPAMLAKAVEGRYRAWALRETPDAIRSRWFRPVPGGVEVVPGLRREVGFRRYNVADEDAALWRPGQYDVIFCRNLLMYLTVPAAARLVRRMTEALAEGGYLFLGHTDSLGSRPSGLQARQGYGAFYYRRADPRPAAEVGTPGPREAPPPVPVVGPAPGRPALADLEFQVFGLLRTERFAEALTVLESRLCADPPPRGLLLQGVLLAQAGRLPEAETVARRLLDLDALSADANHLLAVCLESGPSIDAAIRHYRMAAHLDPDFAMPRLRLGLLARRRGEDARADLDPALWLLPGESDERITLFGGGFGRLALIALCRGELAEPGVRR